MRHLLGVMGVLAAGVLLAVSAAMNWRFGFSLGRTELDGQIYGAASAAADCLKALVPFFFFAAVRNKMWSQAVASVLVWVVVTGYSMTSALGHAALNRFDSTGHRAQAAQAYQDLRGDLKRLEEQAGWNPQHRPYEAVMAAIESHKAQGGWKWSNGCKDVSSKSEQKYCQAFHNLEAEAAAAKAGTTGDAKIVEVKARLADMEGSPALSEADPQAKVLTELAATFFPNVKIDNVQMALTIFVALLLEVGSGFGMYVAFSQWRLYDTKAPAAPRMVAVYDDTVAATVAAPALTQAAVQVKKPRSGANDNKTVEKTIEVAVIEAKPVEVRASEVRVMEAKAQPRRVAPESDVERYYKENVDTQDGSAVTATQLYEDYCSWCETKAKEPLALPSFGRQFGELGVRKEKNLAGRVQYVGIALKSDAGIEEAMKSPLYRADAA